MRHYFIVIISLISISLGFSQEAQQNTDSFTLEEAIAFALENSYKAINAERDVLDAKKQKWETIAAGLPQISGAVNYQNQLKQQINQFPTIIVPPEFLPEGVIQGPDTFIPIVFGQPQSVRATATLTQQIFDGSYIVGVQATKSFLSFSVNNKEKTQLEVRKAVTESYGNVLLARESAAILVKNKVNLEKNLFETTKIFENGLGEEESVEQLQITLSNVENQLKNAQRLENITLQMLNLIMGIAIDAPTKLEDNLENLTVEKAALDVLESDFDIENNVDFKLATNLNEQRYFEWKLSRSRALPTLNAFVNYGATAFAEDFNFLSNNQEWFDASVLGFDLSIPIFSSLKRSASTQRAKIALEKAKTQLQESKEQIRLQLENAKSEYILAIEEYETAKQNLNLSERIEKKNQTKYYEGIASSFELRQAQTQLYQAQQTFLQSMVAVINKKTQVETIINE